MCTPPPKKNNVCCKKVQNIMPSLSLVYFCGLFCALARDTATNAQITPQKKSCYAKLTVHIFPVFFCAQAPIFGAHCYVPFVDIVVVVLPLLFLHSRLHYANSWPIGLILKPPPEHKPRRLRRPAGPCKGRQRPAARQPQPPEPRQGHGTSHNPHYTYHHFFLICY